MIDPRPISEFKFTRDEYDLYQSGVEIWRDIDNYIGYYQISTFGRVKSLLRRVPHPRSGMLTIQERLMKITIAKIGYPIVGLHGANGNKLHYVHILIGVAFLSNPLNRNEINHRDTKKANSYLSNIEYCTHSENMQHCYNNNLRVPPMGMLGKFGKDHHSSKPIIQYDLDGNFIARFNGGYEAGRETGTNKGNLAACALGMVKTAGGFKWKYECDLVSLP